MKIGRILALLLLAGGFVAAGVAYKLYADIDAFRRSTHGDETEKVVEVPSGASARAVVRALSRAGVLSDEELAWRYVKYVKRDRRPMKAGEYGFQGPLTPDEVLERVYRGDVKTYHFTVPEGLRLDEVATVVEASGLATAQEVLALARDPAVARDLDIPLANLEGYLFPDTYTFPKNPKPRAIVDAMVRRAKEEYRKADEQRDPAVMLDERETMTLASIVEKETGQPDERPRIACVFHNRLKRGMLLQTDPTVMYATMLRNGGRWSQNITRSDLQTPHPYNTYTTPGLPPGPIASPGSAAIRAALRPSDCVDLFFVSRNDGGHVFCPDLACHNAAVRKWQVEFFRGGSGTEEAAAPSKRDASPSRAKAVAKPGRKRPASAQRSRQAGKRPPKVAKGRHG